MTHSHTATPNIYVCNTYYAQSKSCTRHATMCGGGVHFPVYASTGALFYSTFICLSVCGVVCLWQWLKCKRAQVHTFISATQTHTHLLLPLTRRTQRPRRTKKFTQNKTQFFFVGEFLVGAEAIISHCAPHSPYTPDLHENVYVFVASLQ